MAHTQKQNIAELARHRTRAKTRKKIQDTKKKESKNLSFLVRHLAAS